MPMSLVSFCYHSFVFLLGVLFSIPFALILIYIFTAHIAHDPLQHASARLFSSEPAMLTLRHKEPSVPSVWMFAILISESRPSHRRRIQGVYVTLYRQYLYVHLTSKRLRRIRQQRIPFSHVLIFDLSHARVELRPLQQVRAHYWSNKTPLALNQLQCRAEYQISKKTKKNDSKETLVDRLRPVDSPWLTEKVKILLFLSVSLSLSLFRSTEEATDDEK